jgi:hypothetical protein
MLTPNQYNNNTPLMKSIYSSFLIALLGFLLVNASPVFGQAAASTTTEPKVKKIPFHGALQSVDASAQTITIAGKTPRVFHLTPTTKITDGSGNPSSILAAVVGEDVGGSYTKDSAGAMTLYSVRFGAKPGSKTSSTTPAPTASTPAPAPAPAPAATTPSPAPSAAPATETASAPAAAAAATTTPAAKVKKQTFSGKVVSVDGTANTLVIHGKADQTFTVTPTTKITGADGLAGVTVGAKVSGSYSKSADGATLTVYTLKVTK